MAAKAWQVVYTRQRRNPGNELRDGCDDDGIWVGWQPLVV